MNATRGRARASEDGRRQTGVAPGSGEANTAASAQSWNRWPTISHTAWPQMQPPPTFRERLGPENPSGELFTQAMGTLFSPICETRRLSIVAPHECVSSAPSTPTRRRPSMEKLFIYLESDKGSVLLTSPNRRGWTVSLAMNDPSHHMGDNPHPWQEGTDRMVFLLPQYSDP